MALILLALPLSANGFELDTNDAFVVKDVPVRVEVDALTRKTSDARDKAIQIGAVHALMLLAHDVLTIEDFARMPALLYSDIESVIRGYQVRGEELDGGTYRATISYAYYKQRVEKLLESYDIVLKEYHKEPILVIPLLRWEDEYVLWQDENPWQQAWNRVADDNKSWFVTIPFGDAQDLSTIHISDVLSKDYTILKELQKRYAATYVVIAEAHMGSSDMRVEMEVLGQNRDRHYLANYVLTDSTDISKLMYRTAFDAGRYLFQFRKDHSNKPKWFETKVLLTAATEKERIAMFGYFDDLRLTPELTIDEVSAQGILVTLRHADTPDTLKAYLENEGFIVARSANGWQVRKLDGADSK